MQKFVPNMNLLEDVITVSNMNEIADTVSRVKALDNTTKLGQGKSDFVAGVIRATAGSEIPRWSTVTISGAVGIKKDQALSAGEALRPVVTCATWVDSDHPADKENEKSWGLLLDAVQPGMVARVLVFGITACKITFSEGDTYAKPSESGLVSTPESAPVKIIWVHDEAGSDGKRWAVIQIVEISSFPGWRQWNVSVEGDAVQVGPGHLAWGGGNNAIWPGGSLTGSIPVGSSRYVLWYTKSPPCPTGECPDKKGNPGSFVADAGSVVFSEAAEGEEDWTDWRVIASVKRTEDGYETNQILTSEITVNAIVGVDEDEDPDPEEEEPEAPPCGHPGNAPGAGTGTDDGDHTQTDNSHPEDTRHDVSDGGTGHPADGEGDDGITPESGGECNE